jgi:signal transduction histidine kinase/response regulator RpfG family c-di-GMP phosphodiesterase
MRAEDEMVNILIVDDSPANLLAMEAILQGDERNLVKASSGDEALRYLLENDVAVILLDVHMPGIDGLETAALIRGREKSRGVPIIFITADSTGHRHIERGYALGAVDYILKPVEPEVLRAKVAVFVELFKKTKEIERQAALLREKNLELENANLQRLGMLIELGQELAAERDPARVLEQFSAAARHIVGAEHAGVGVLGAGGDERLLHFFASDMEGSEWTNAAEPLPDEGLCGRLLRDGRPLRLSRRDGTLPLKELPSSRPAARSFLGAPILHSGGVVGWLYLTDKLDSAEFNEADERLAVTLATQVAVSYENARLYTEAQSHAAALQQEVAERKQAEQARAQLLVREQAARAEAERANRVKDEFLATLSHELRTPLTAILGWSRMLRTGQLDEAMRARALETIERNAYSQSQLIDELLDVSRIVTGKLTLSSRPVELLPVVEAAIDSIRPTADAKSVSLDVLLDPAAGKVSGDPSRLQQVIWNLFSNAVKFTPSGGRVSVRLERDGASARITVSDTGVGIDPQLIPYIFDRFRQADGSTTREHGGLGLGLAIVRHLVELHGGTARASSEGRGRGATFTVILPLSREAEAGEGVREGGRDADGRTLKNAGALEGLRILLVDDVADARGLIAAVLRGRGAVVRECGSAAEALELLDTRATDLLLSDIGMPHQDGYSLIAQVRQHDAGRHLPAIALTAYATAEDRARALSAGFHMHLAKPVDTEQLITAVASLAGQHAKT